MTALPSVEECKAITRRRLQEAGQDPSQHKITIVYRRGAEWLADVQPLPRVRRKEEPQP